MPLVYIADDEPHIRRLAAIGLKDAGFETAEFSDGAVLLHAVQQRQPDAVLLDWMMPGQDGLEVLRAMRENPITRADPDPYDDRPNRRGGSGARAGAGSGRLCHQAVQR